MTVFGVLGRTPDVARFALTLPHGETLSLEVDAVKSAKRVAGTIGQSLVELELDAKRLPERFLPAITQKKWNPNLDQQSFYIYDPKAASADPKAASADYIPSLPTGE